MGPVRLVVVAAALVVLCACSVAPDEHDAGEPGGEPRAPSDFFGGSADEWMALRATCIEEAGWEVVFDESGGFEVPSLRADQREAFQRVLADCDARHGLLPPEDRLTEAEIRQLYPLAVAARECLVAEGHEISEPPSEDWFVEHYHDPGWHPHDELAGVVGAEWDRLDQVCPQPRLHDQ